MKAHYYNVEIKWSGGRKGLMCSPDVSSNIGLAGCIEVATPPEFPMGIEGIWSPEHLFTASIVSCFMTTFLAIAEKSKLNFTGFKCKASGKLDESNGEMSMTEVELQPEVALHDEEHRERAMRVLHLAENACLITNSVNSTVVVKPSVVVNLYQ